MKSKLVFNGVSSEDLGVVIQTPPTYEYPERVVTTAHIPGRNGDLVIDESSYKNVNRTYNLGMGYGAIKHHTPNAQTLTEWLTSAKGHYVRLEDTYDPDVYRLAMYNASGSFIDHFEQALSCSISFECKPQRFLKEGDVEIEYPNGHEARIVNDYHYEALPLIKIEGIQKSLSEVLMMTLSNNNDILSSISITDVDNGVVYIDSTEQNCYDNDGDINEKVSLNGKDFPKLLGGLNVISIGKYLKEYGTIQSYNNVISDAQTVLKSEYKPYDVLEAAQQNKVFIRAFNTLIDDKKISFNANSYQAYINDLSDKQNLTDIADTYTFKSFNTLINNYCEQFSFSGDISSVTTPDWVSLSVNSQDSEMVDITVKRAGYLMASNQNGFMFYNAETLLTTVRKSSNTTVTFIERDSTKNAPVITYDDLPDWLDFEFVELNGAFSKIKYKLNKAGYVWSEKTSIFGKATWNEYPAGTVLTELAWNTLKKAFMPTAGLFTSTTVSFKYRYLSQVIDYQDEEANFFKVSSTDSHLSSITLVSKDSGYYKCIVSGKIDEAEWIRVERNTNIKTIKGTESFEMQYLGNVPTYSDEENFPDWLDPKPALTYTKNPLMATKISFKVTKTSKYRYSYKNNDDEMYSDWVEIQNGAVIDMSSHGNKNLSDSFYICQIDTIPVEYSNDRAFNDSSTIPSWLTVEYYDDPDTNEKKIRYLSKNAGYFKWDSNSAWVKKDPNDMLLTTGYKDNTVFYYLNTLPDYTEYEFKNYLNITINEDSGGNPTEVNIICKVPGYYRVNSNSDWTWFNTGDTLFVATVGEQIKVYYLKDLNDPSTNIKISITPHWWML